MSSDIDICDLPGYGCVEGGGDHRRVSPGRAALAALPAAARKDGLSKMDSDLELSGRLPIFRSFAHDGTKPIHAVWRRARNAPEQVDIGRSKIDQMTATGVDADG